MKFVLHFVCELMTKITLTIVRNNNVTYDGATFVIFEFGFFGPSLSAPALSRPACAASPAGDVTVHA